MKPEPSIPEKIAAETTLAGLEGFAYGLKFQGLDTEENMRLIAMRRYEIQKRMRYRK